MKGEASFHSKTGRLIFEPQVLAITTTAETLTEKESPGVTPWTLRKDGNSVGFRSAKVCKFKLLFYKLLDCDPA